MKKTSVASLIVLDESAVNLNEELNMNDGNRSASQGSNLGVLNEDSGSKEEIKIEESILRLMLQ